MSKQSERARSWSFIVYPESAPEDWRTVIDSHHVQWAESPLHCFDEDPGTGELKKAHWHIAIFFESLKAYEQVKVISDSINASFPVRCLSLRGMIRYFAHMDNPEKYQYPVDQIVGHGGMDVQDLLRVSASARYHIIVAMCRWIKDNNITEFCELFDFAAMQHSEDWLPLLCDNSCYIVSQYIKSIREGQRREIHP